MRRGKEEGQNRKVMLVRIGKSSPEWWWLKDKEGKILQKKKKRRVQGPERGPQVKQTGPWLAQFT